MVKAYKYVYEGYDDPIHRYGHFKGTKFYIPSPYNIGILEIHRKVQYIKKQTKIDDFPHYIPHPEIVEIDMNEDLINKILANYEVQENMLKERETFIDGFDEYKKDEEIAEEIFRYALKQLNDREYEKSIITNQQILSKYPHVEKIVLTTYYNIACGYSLLKNEEKMYEYLLQSVENGYIDWPHIITDSDLREYRETPNFVKIIQKCITKDEKVKENIKRVSINVQEYIERHKINLNSISI
jgi:hypothetical protein